VLDAHGHRAPAFECGDAGGEDAVRTKGLRNSSNCVALMYWASGGGVPKSFDFRQTKLRDFADETSS
jgi:hypothetical protein